MEATKDFLDSLLKKNPTPTQANDSPSPKSEILPEKASKESGNSKITSQPTEKIEETTTKSLPIEKEEISKIQSSNDSNTINKESNQKMQDKDKESISPQPQENKISKEDHESGNSLKKEESKEDEKDKEKEKAQESNPKPIKEKPKEEYIFPIPNATPKIEESKNSDPSFFLYKFPQVQHNFNSIDLNIPESLRPRNKDSQPQSPHLFQSYNMSYFNPITFSCSLNTHSVRKCESPK